jgi:cell division protein ZapA
MGQDTNVVSVEILGLRYPIRSSLDAGYVTELAAYVDAKMHAAAEDTEAADSVKIAVVAALNIADELFRAREGDQPPASAVDQVRDRLSALEALLDRVLAPEAAEAATPLATPGGTD